MPIITRLDAAYWTDRELEIRDDLRVTKCSRSPTRFLDETALLSYLVWLKKMAARKYNNVPRNDTSMRFGPS